jgi:transcriptional regulator with XRE-family HTH domain
MHTKIPFSYHAHNSQDSFFDLHPYTARCNVNCLPELVMKERIIEGFGARLAQLRKARGLTQSELGEAVGASKRVVAYYEADSAQPPGALLVELARVLRVSADELLGIRIIKQKTSPKTARLLKRLQRVERLPPADQRAVLKLVDAFLDSRGVA